MAEVVFRKAPSVLGLLGTIRRGVGLDLLKTMVGYHTIRRH